MIEVNLGGSMDITVFDNTKQYSIFLTAILTLLQLGNLIIPISPLAVHKT
jgi:hypothetical protein